MNKYLIIESIEKPIQSGTFKGMASCLFYDGKWREEYISVEKALKITGPKVTKFGYQCIKF